MLPKYKKIKKSLSVKVYFHNPLYLPTISWDNFRQHFQIILQIEHNKVLKNVNMCFKSLNLMAISSKTTKCDQKLLQKSKMLVRNIERVSHIC